MANVSQQTKPARGARRQVIEEGTAMSLARNAIFWWIPFFYFLVSDSFYLRTYDSAQVKITVVQMGGVCLLALWLCLLIEEGFKAFRKKDLIILAPFIAFFGSGVFSFLHAPYQGPSIDDFIRRCVYMTVALILVREFTEPAVRRLTRWIVITAAVAILYGFLQFIDTRFFYNTPGPGNGIDPFIWRMAFEKRVFSTFGNPNFFADFLVITWPILVCQWLRTRKFWYLPLTALLLLDLYATETKGAWIGFTVSLSIFILVYSLFFVEGDVRRLLKRAAWIVGGVVAVLGAIVGYYTHKRMQSVNFRTATWESTFEMIETHPFLGTGIGSFKVIYPAFRRPVIFHIEDKSNTETDHAENEWLESWFDEGVLGFGIFIWLVFSTCFIGIKAIGQLTGLLADKGGRPPPRAYDLLGYLIAFMGMLCHNFFDVSMRFVSSGVYLGLLAGLIVNLSMGFPLSQVVDVSEQAGDTQSDLELGGLWLLRLAAWGALAYAAYAFLSQFSELQGSLAQFQTQGEVLQYYIAWALFGSVVLGLGGVMAALVLRTRRLLVPAVIGASVPALFLFWGYFKADVYHNMAIAFSKGGQWTPAVQYYIKVASLNPNYVMTNYFKGNVFVDRFDMTKEYHPEWGDTNNVPRDDFERAEAAYQQVLDKAPNYVQTHHQRGVLYFKRGQYEMDHGHPDEAKRYWDEAIHQFRKYQNLDPVFFPNYMRLAQVYISEKRIDDAIEVYNEYLDAKACVVHRHDNPPTPDATEAYALLGNAYMMKGDLRQAQQDYVRALQLDPNNSYARQNLQYLYQQAQKFHLLRPPPAAPSPRPASAPPPGARPVPLRVP